MQPPQPQVYQQPVYQQPEPEVHNYIEVVEYVEEEEPIRDSVPAYNHQQTLDMLNIGDKLTTKLFKNESSTLQSKMKKTVPLLGLLSFASYKIVFDQKLINYINHYGMDKFLSGSWKIVNNGGLSLIKGLGVISALTSVFFISKAASELKELQNEKSHLRELNEDWSFNQTYPAYNAVYKATVNRIVEKTEEALDNLIDKKVQEIAFLVLSLIAETIVLTGAFSGSAVILAAGAILCTSVALAGLLHLGYNYLKNQNETDANDLEHDLEIVETIGIRTN